MKIKLVLFLVSNFCRVLNVVCFLLGNSLASDARELPRRKHTTFKTQQKFEIKNTSLLWGANCKTHSTIRKTPNQDIKFRRQEITQMKAYKLLFLECVRT